MGLIVQHRDECSLHRARHHHAEVLPQAKDLLDERGIACDEPCTVAGGVGALRHGMHRNESGDVALADGRIQHGDRLGVPAEFAIALIIDEHRAQLAGPCDEAAELVDGKDPARRVGR